MNDNGIYFSKEYYNSENEHFETISFSLSQFSIS